MSEQATAPGGPRVEQGRSSRWWRRLWWSAGLFAVASAVHAIDHLRRGQGTVSDALLAAGNLSLVLQVAVVTLVLVRHRSAPLVAAAAGPSLALGFAAAHWLPTWSDLSDPVWEIDGLRWLSATTSAAEIVTAALLGAVGLGTWRREATGSANLARSPAAAGSEPA